MSFLLTSLDNQNLLRVLEVFAVALVWLFFLRVIRAVWVEVKPPRARAGAVVETRRVPAPAPDARRSPRAKRLTLKVIEPEGSRGTVYELGEEMTVGRAAGCGVRIDDAYTSNLHARVFRADGTLWVEDLGSTNGTWVNAQRIDDRTKLGRGDLLQVGGTVFEVTR